MCDPIAKRIGVAQLDDFACRQLTNLGYGMPAQLYHNGAEAVSSSLSLTGSSNLRKRTKDQVDRQASDGMECEYRHGEERESLIPPQPAQQPQLPAQQPQLPQQPQHHAQADGGSGGSRGWGVGSLVASAKGRALAYREDSMRRLKYCLDWVAYATALLHQHIEDLRRLLALLQEAARTGIAAADGTAMVAVPNASVLQQIVQDAAHRLALARREIVHTVRKAVGVVSHYAGAVLPGEARRQVRVMILSLPRRWASADTVLGASSSSGSVSGSDGGSTGIASNGSSPLASPRHGPRAEMRPENAEAAARRTLVFATESFNMLDNVRSIFYNLHANAERWIGPSPAVPQEETSQPPETVPLTDVHAYRDPASSASPATLAPPPVRRPPRRLPVAVGASSDMDTTGGERGPASESLVEIGEQMRRMDIIALQQEQHMHMQTKLGALESRSAGGSPALRPAGAAGGWPAHRASDDLSAAVHKRSRTREPTPTRM
ncbi:transcriptional regulator opi1 [Coemansia biformis]|uniref:Transcriptional regulator opi1 n=1 Tax=Coemansia biformis TaxID=1286918 RepID=A0A9W7YF78_9FUNG|nr:transcriptional regulator opi1 [Coemansia biformis]